MGFEPDCKHLYFCSEVERFKVGLIGDSAAFGASPGGHSVNCILHLSKLNSKKKKRRRTGTESFPVLVSFRSTVI